MSPFRSLSHSHLLYPDYRERNIVNLINSILKGLGAKNKYPVLPDLVEQVKAAENVVLLVIDGLGLDNLKRLNQQHPHGFLARHLQGSLTSTFPSTTTAAITTFFTGLTPQEHGIISLFTYFSEWDKSVAVLPYWTREGEVLDPKRFRLKQLALPPGIFGQIKAEGHMVSKRKIFRRPYNDYLCRGAKLWGINNLNGLLTKVQKIIASGPQKKYIYAYWSGFDDFSHESGKEHPKTQNYVWYIDYLLKNFSKQMKGKNTLLIVTADHGQVSTTLKRTIILNKHPLFRDCLARPLCGEARTIFCFVLPQKRQQFERYFRRNFSHYAELYPSRELAEKGFFGQHQPHPRFWERIGDYIILPKENYVFREFLPQEERRLLVGYHGGLSSEEMLVPLVVARF